MLTPGQTVGSYELVRKLGGGAFGEVWLARHVELGAECALKIPTDPDYVRQLRKEGQIQFGLKHPNIVGTVDLNTLHDPPYFVMEYVEGTDLRKYLTACGKLRLAEAMGIVGQILEALKAAHAKGVLHRDLKPENVLRTPDGAVKVTDFGLGKVQADVAQSLLLSGSMMSREGKSVSGTFAYMSPEQASGEPPDPRDDLYAVGVIGCELLTGSRPIGIGVARMFEREGIAEAYAEVFEKALDDRPHRYASAAAMLAATREAGAAKERRAADAERERRQRERQARAERRKEADEEHRRQREAERKVAAERQREAEERTQRAADLERILLEREERDAERAAREAGERQARERAEHEAAARAAQPVVPPAPAKPSKKRGGCGCLVLLVLAGAFLFFSDGGKGLRTRARNFFESILPASSELELDLGNGVKMTMILVQPGEFTMGSKDRPDKVFKLWTGDPIEWEVTGHPAHQVQLTHRFYLSKTEVTRAQFERFALAKSYKTDAEERGKAVGQRNGAWDEYAGLSWRNPGFEQGPDHPVVCVSWNDALAFCQWLTEREGRDYDLPTEAQWEYACRAGSTTPWPWGANPAELWRHANASGLESSGPPPLGPRAPLGPRYVYTAPVASFAANGFKLFDMIGNASEWCRDGYSETYGDGSVRKDPGAPSTRPRLSPWELRPEQLGFLFPNKVVRGGSWADGPPVCRSVSRAKVAGGDADARIGFRIARTLK